jgi:hypothetical protein
MSPTVKHTYKYHDISTAMLVPADAGLNPDNKS